MWQIAVLLDDKIGASLALSEAAITATRSTLFAVWAVSSGVTGYLGDRIERKHLAVSAGLLFILHLMLSASSQGFCTLLLARILGGAACGATTTGFIMAMDITSPEKRVSTATKMNVWCAMSVFLFLSVHWFAKHAKFSWRTELRIDAALLSLNFGLVAALYPARSVDSLPQMASELENLALLESELAVVDDDTLKSRREQRWSRERADSPKIRVAQEVEPSLHKSRSIFSPVWRLCTLALCFVAVSLNYYTLSFMAGNLSSNIAWNIALLELFDLPGYHLADWFGNRFKEGKTATILLGLSGIMLLLLSALSASGRGASAFLCFGLAGKMCVAAAWQAVYLLIDIAFQPEHRATGYGFCASTARVTGMMAPILVHWVPPTVSSALIAAVSLFAAVAVAFEASFGW